MIKYIDIINKNIELKLSKNYNIMKYLQIGFKKLVLS